MSTHSVSSTTPTTPSSVSGLYAEQYQPLHRFAYSILKDHNLSDDAVQTAFMRLLQQEQGKTDGHEVPWLFMVTRNICYKILRKNNRYCEMEIEEADRIVDEGMSPDAVLEKTEIFSEISEDLKEAITKLSSAQRECLQLRYFSGLSYKEISEILETSESTVGFNIHAAKAKLKRFLSFTH